MGMNYKELLKHYRTDAPAAGRMLRESLQTRQLRPREFEFGKLFVECFGFSEFDSCRGGHQLANEVFSRRLTEAEGAVSTAAFQNISGQIVYAETMEKYQAEEFVIAKMIPERNAVILDGEKIAGITELGNAASVRKEGDPYKIAGVGEDWIFTPPIKDRGLIVPVTWEAVFNDRTGDVLDRAGDVGTSIGVGEEIDAVDSLIDENVTAHRYNWRNAGQIATYGDNSGSHSWDNLAASNGLVDWTDINGAMQVFNALVNPFTGLPIAVDAKHLIVTKENEQTALRILNATEIRVATPGYATSGNPTQTVVKNPYEGKFQLVTSRYLAYRMATDTDWFLGDVGKLLRRMVAEPMNVVQAPSGNKDEFERRIVNQYRANKRYAHVVVQPRAMVKSTA